jgi:hypothetical protein
MTSQINPESNNYDAAYPVAGQDNNTIGFRQNFASIQQNFQYAKDEITALQTNTVQAGGNVLNDLNGAVLYDAKLQNQSYADINLGNTANIANVNYTVAAYQTLTPTANTTISFSGLPANAAAILTLSITANAASNIATPYTVTIPNVSSATSGVIGLSGNTLSFPRTNSTNAGTHTYQLLTTTGGSAFTITPLSTTTQPLNSTSEDVAPSANVNLGVSDSYFSTSTALSGVVITGTGGTFTCTAASKTLVIGDKITISGTYGGSGSIVGYSDPTSYYIIATNGSTTFTLSASLGGGAITTTAGTPTGLTYTVTETATLPAGVNGQVKVLAMLADSGDMEITVTNAGWKTSGTGTITFDTIGDACTLKYINSKWFCIGNNGCVFA